MRTKRWLSLFAALAVLGCSNKSTAPNEHLTPRSFRMGFSAIGPDTTHASTFASLEAWTKRADAAIMHVSAPYKALLTGTTATTYVNTVDLPLANYYRGKNLMIVITVDVTNGLDRSAEDPDLVAMHRSITEPAVQQVYREYIAAVDSILHPEYLGLAMEVNLIRAIAPPSVYAAVVTMSAGGENTLVAQNSPAKRFVSMQVETAWGRLPDVGHFVGIDKERADFPYIKALGLSSYPYLAGFANPNDVPIDYYARLNSSAAALPMLVVEGGWSSGSVPGVTSSPELQAQWIKRQMQIADRGALVAVTQISFTDLDLSSYPAPPGSILSLFGQLGLVDVNFNPKPALAEWDRALARQLRTQ